MESSKKKWMIIGMLAIFVVVSGIVGVLFYQNQQQKQEKEFAKTLKINQPEDVSDGSSMQGFYDYDLTTYKAMFTIMAVNSEDQTMQLQFVHPLKLQGNEITSKVMCSKENTWVYGKENGLVSALQTVYEETRIIPGQTLMQALCADQYCRVIRKYCELWL